MSEPATATAPSALSEMARRPAVDLPTAAVILLMVAGFPATVVAAHLGHLPLWAAFLIGTFLMNLSFTAWHEPAHGNFSSSRGLNHLAGVVASVASVYPGWFARRREHLIHHRFEGDPQKDPVFARIQAGSGWGFLARLLRVALTGEDWNRHVPQDYLPRGPAQRAADLAMVGASLALTGLSVWLGFWPALVAGWIAPRFAILVLHAWYICWLPHGRPGGGFVVLRVRGGALLRFLTVGQSLHGIHHRWPAIPWHAYRRVLRDHAAEVEAAGVERL